MKIISVLTNHDLNVAYQLEKICHPIPWSESTFFSNQGRHYINKKITIDEQIVGFLICQTVADEATLFNLVIHPDFRQQGLAKDLLLVLIEELTLQKISTLWLEVRASNIAAITLYHHLGFNELTIRKNYYPTQNQDREDAIIMAYTLSL